MSRKVKYSKEFKLKAVQSILRDGQGITAVSDRLTLNESDLKKWVKYYELYGISSLEPRFTNSKYPLSFRSKVIYDIECKGLSIREAALKFNVPSHSTVQKWFVAYQEKGSFGLREKPKGRPKTMNKDKPKERPKKPPTREEELLRENESLRAELALLKKLHALAQAKKKKR
ncbi:MAG: transposase [Flavobacteriaceae bacterium]